MVGHRNCSIIGCANSGAKLKKWIDKICAIHGCNQGRGHCICPPPFALYPFPTLQNAEQRRKWIQAVKRKDERGKNWEPNQDSRVCSDHFVDGKPTSNNPDPTLKLGYTSVLKQGKSRKLPTFRVSRDSPAPKVAKLENTQARDSPAPKVAKLEIPQARDSPAPKVAKREIPQARDSPAPKVAKLEIPQARDSPAPKVVKLEIPQARDSPAPKVAKLETSMQPEVNWKCQNKDCQQHINAMEDKVNKLENLVAQHRREAQLWKQKFVKEQKTFTHKSLNYEKVKAFTGIPNRTAFNVLYRLLKNKGPKN